MAVSYVAPAEPCAQEAHAQNHYDRERRRKRDRAGEWASRQKIEPYSRPCQLCGREFLSKMPATYARLCSRTCRHKWSYAHRNYRHICAECGREFINGQWKATCCSDECFRARMRHQQLERVAGMRKYATKTDRDRYYGYHRRAVVATAGAERFSSETIFERDRWRCRICGGRVDKRLKWPHAKSASLDHIVPISQGGKHIRSNVQCAHLGCNSRKGAGMGGQLLLFG